MRAMGAVTSSRSHPSAPHNDHEVIHLEQIAPISGADHKAVRGQVSRGKRFRRRRATRTPARNGWLFYPESKIAHRTHRFKLAIAFGKRAKPRNLDLAQNRNQLVDHCLLLSKMSVLRFNGEEGSFSQRCEIAKRAIRTGRRD